MLKFYNTSLEQLIELYNLITDDTNDFNEMLSAYDNNEEQLREDIINNITDELLDNYNYDGDYEDYNAIYWYVKGVKSIPPPPDHLNPPKRYDQSDDYINRINKRKDDALFNELHKLKHKDVMAHRAADEILNEFNKHRAQTKFNDKLKKETTTIHASKANYQRMLKDLINNKPLLRPLAPEIMKELKPYHQKLFEGENELFIDWISNFGHEFESKDVDHLIVNIPHDYSQAKRLLREHQSLYTKDSDIVTKNKNKDPIVVYYLNKFKDLDDIFGYLENTVFKSERKPFKLTFELSGIFETPIKQNDEVIRYDYEKRAIYGTNYKYHRE